MTIAWITVMGVIILGLLWVYPYIEPQETANQRRAAAALKADIASYAEHRSKMICPHCQEVGHVYVKSVSRKTGVHGDKVTAMLLTGGLSLLATGLSGHAERTAAICKNCNCRWEI